MEKQKLEGKSHEMSTWKKMTKKNDTMNRLHHLEKKTIGHQMKMCY
jgi:hypothetical protein